VDKDGICAGGLDVSNDEATTKPTLETLLERINGVEQVVLATVNQLRSDVEQGFRRVERKIELLTQDRVTHSCCAVKESTLELTSS
jgi:hypothetical protein